MSDQHELSRRDELLADRASVGLSAEEARELEALLAGVPDDSYDLAAASLDLALAPPTAETLSPELRAKLAARADAFVVQRAAVAKRAEMRVLPSEPRRSSALAWWVAAAAVVLALIGWWPRFGAGPAALAPTPSELLARADTLRVAAKGTAYAANLSGDVLWSNATQSGYLRLSGLPVNDPKLEQYQLWIVDGTQKHPIDGGVFDVDAATGELVIPIDAKIAVTSPAAFAITVEKPGGVVVSDQSKVAMLVSV